MKTSDARLPDMPLDIRPFLHDIESSPDERSIERALKPALRRLPEGERLSFFAHAITSPLPHAAKAALWRVVRYSHFWWNVDALLQGDVMENPVVQRAFADAVAMRRWKIRQWLPGWEDLLPTLSGHELDGIVPVPEPVGILNRQYLIAFLVRVKDDVLANILRKRFDVPDIRDFIDVRGNGILWYLTYRDDQNADGGFACPKTARVLVDMGADPYRTNELGLCWNDVARHFVR